MSFLRRSRAVAVLGFACLAVSAADSPQVPAFAGEWGSRPAWVAEEYAVDASGELNAALLGDDVARTRADLARKNAKEVARLKAAAAGSEAGTRSSENDNCQRAVTWLTHHFEPNRNLDDLVAHADVIVAGTVIAQRQGIYYDIPGTLLLLKAEYLKGEPAGTTYLFYPYANIRTAHGVLCSRALNKNHIPPNVGDRFIAFSMRAPYREDGFTILAPDSTRELVRETREGTLDVPPAIRSVMPEPLAFDRVRERIRAALDRRR